MAPIASCHVGEHIDGPSSVTAGRPGQDRRLRRLPLSRLGLSPDSHRLRDRGAGTIPARGEVGDEPWNSG